MANENYVEIRYEMNSADLAREATGKDNKEIEPIISKLKRDIDQAHRDAVTGTFAQYRKSLFGGEDVFKRFEAERRRLSKYEFLAKNDEVRAGKVRFNLKLSASLFREPRAALQHLIGILSGDLFGRSSLSGVKVVGITLGRVGKDLENRFGSRSHTRKQIRSAFQLDFKAGKTVRRMPLLAFSFKPRNGTTEATVEDVCRRVFAAGFNIVEMDTRNLATIDEQWQKCFFKIAENAAKLNDPAKGLARFSLNLSLPPDLAVPIARRFKAVHPEKTPWVVKVDGGLDGISTIQALRDAFDADSQPIITCYPILNYVLDVRLGPDVFLDMLILSGADIVYPGGAPRIGEGDTIQHEQYEAGYHRYWDFLSRSRVMPSIAGGVHAGQLPVDHEFFGPNVAYFFGGGVALHVNGAAGNGKTPQHKEFGDVTDRYGGADICREILQRMAELQDDPEPDYDKLQADYSLVHNHYVAKGDETPEAHFQFQNPKKFLSDSIVRYTERQQVDI